LVGAGGNFFQLPKDSAKTDVAMKERNDKVTKKPLR
jgi:hypothetical protein